MKWLKKLFFVLMPLVLLINSCTNKDKLPKEIIPVKKMSSIMLDLKIAKAYNYTYFPQYDTTYPKDRGKRLKVFDLQIFKLHKVDTTTFLTSFDYYTHHPDWLQKVYKTMQDSLKSKIKRHRKITDARRKAYEKLQGQHKSTPTPLHKFLKSWQTLSDSSFRQISHFDWPALFPKATHSDKLKLKKATVKPK